MNQLEREDPFMVQAKTEREIAKACLAAAGAVGRWTLTDSETGQAERDWDGEIKLAWSGGHRKFACVVIPRLTRETLPVAVDRSSRAKTSGATPLLLSRHVTPRLADELRQRDVQFLDAAGNGYLSGDGLYVWIVGKRATSPTPRRPRIFKTAGLKLLFVLMSTPDAVNWTQRELARAAGVALGGIGMAMKDLLDMGYITRTGPRSRKLANTTHLVGRWDTGYAETLRPALDGGTFRIRTPRELESWTHDNMSRIREVGALLGGEAGAALVIKGFRPERAVIHVPEGDPATIAQEMGLLPDPNGQVMLIGTFGKRNAWTDSPSRMSLADPLLLRAELVMETDERLQPSRRTLLEDYILRRLARDT
jgi:hypothetical protein